MGGAWEKENSAPRLRTRTGKPGRGRTEAGFLHPAPRVSLTLPFYGEAPMGSVTWDVTWANLLPSLGLSFPSFEMRMLVPA